ncbi:MAG: hypothetical protein AAF567_02870 [Actinomycetota bacterium]
MWYTSKVMARRCTGVLLLAILVATAGFSNEARAQSNPVVVSIPDYAVTDTSSVLGVVITVNPDTTPINIMRFGVRFDPTVLRPLGGTAACTFGPGFVGSCVLPTSPDHLNIELFSSGGVASSQMAIVLFFDVIGAPGTTSPIAFQQHSVFGEQQVTAIDVPPLTVDWRDGSVMIPAVTPPPVPVPPTPVPTPTPTVERLPIAEITEAPADPASPFGFGDVQPVAADPPTAESELAHTGASNHATLIGLTVLGFGAVAAGVARPRPRWHRRSRSQ